MKVEFKKAEITNFLSYGNNITSVELATDKPILIVGNNFVSSSDGSDSNGAGKSSILNAICFALYDEVLFKTNKDKLINNVNKKDMLISIYVIIDDIRYKIQRFRKNKSMGGDGVRILRTTSDNWEFTKDDDITPDSTSNANKLIEKIIGKSFEIFSRIVVFSATSKPFLSLEAGEQISFLEELFGYSEVSERAELIKERNKASKVLFDRESAVNEAIKAELTRRSNQINQMTTMVSEWDSRQAKQIVDAKEKVNSVKDVDFDHHEHVFEKIKRIQDDNVGLKGECQKIEMRLAQMQLTKDKSYSWISNQDIKRGIITKDISELNSINYDIETENAENIAKLTLEKRSKDTIVNGITKSIAEKTRILEKYNDEMASLVDSKCPYCKQDYTEAKCAHEKLQGLSAEMESEILQLTNDLEIHNNELLIIVDKVTKLENSCKYSIAQLSTMKNKLSMLKRELELLDAQENPFNTTESIFLEPESLEDNKRIIEENLNKINTLRDTITIKDSQTLVGMKSDLKHYQNRLFELVAEKNPYQDSLASIINSAIPETKDAQLDEIANLIKHQEFLIKLLTKKDSFVRKNLLQKNLPLLNSSLRSYLQKMGLPHKVTFQENMTAQIKQFDTEMDFNQLSSGQKARINLALSFAFRDVLQYRHGHINFCMLDECLDVGLSNTGVQLAVRFIKEVAEEQKLCLFIISHRDEASSMFDNKLTIHYKNGFSNINVQK